MPRINVVPVKELCDQHLQSEFKSIQSFVSKVFEGKLALNTDRPQYYTTGKGNDKFFTDKLGFVYDRLCRVGAELELRGKPNPDIWPEAFLQRTTTRYWNPYRVTSYAINENRRVLRDTQPKRAKFSEYIKGN